MITDIKAKVDQYSPDVLSEGDMDYPRMSKMGQLWTADWKYKLVAAGKCFRMSMGTVSGTTTYAKTGTFTVTILDQPAGCITVSDGYLIPMELNLGIDSLTAAANNEVSVLMTADRSQRVSTIEISTGGDVKTPDNLLDGGPAFAGGAFSAGDTGLTLPVHSDILYFKHWAALGAATGAGPPDLNVHKEWSIPNFLAGPCTLLLYVNGTIVTCFIGSIVFAHIPANWVPTS